MSKYSCTIVDICDVNDPQADKLVELNKDLGYKIYRHRGGLLTILVTDHMWRGPSSEFIAVADGLYVWREERGEFEHITCKV